MPELPGCLRHAVAPQTLALPVIGYDGLELTGKLGSDDRSPLSYGDILSKLPAETLAVEQIPDNPLAGGGVVPAGEVIA